MMTAEQKMQLYALVDAKVEIMGGFGVVHRGDAYALAAAAYEMAAKPSSGGMTPEQFYQNNDVDAGSDREVAFQFAEAYHRTEAAAQLAEKEREIARLTTMWAESRAQIEKSEQLYRKKTDDYDREHAWLNLAATEADCDLSGVAGAILVLRRERATAEQRLQEAQAEIKLLRHNWNEALKGEDDALRDSRRLDERLRQREAELEQLRTELRVTKLRALSAESLAGIADPKEVAEALALPAPPKVQP